MKTKISILIVNYNTADFIEVSLCSLAHLTKNPYRVFIFDNNSKKEDYLKLKTIVKRYQNCDLRRRATTLKGSLAHGTALNILVKKVTTPYFCVLDADCVWLKKNWDAILLSKMKNKVKVIGTPAPVDSPKPQDFPLVFGALFETKTFCRLDIDFRPKDLTHHLDTGYEMREKYLSHGYKGETLQTKTTRKYKSGPFRNILCAEYYLKGDDGIFASHFGRGSTRGLSKYISTESSWIYRVPYFGYLLALVRGSMEKKSWMVTCREIINHEL